MIINQLKLYKTATSQQMSNTYYVEKSINLQEIYVISWSWNQTTLWCDTTLFLCSTFIHIFYILVCLYIIKLYEFCHSSGKSYVKQTSVKSWFHFINEPINCLKIQPHLFMSIGNFNKIMLIKHTSGIDAGLFLSNFCNIFLSHTTRCSTCIHIFYIFNIFIDYQA